MDNNLDLSHQLRSHGQKITRQRLGILKVLEASAIPLSAQDIYLRLNQEHLPVSLSTIYRNLERMLFEDLVVRQGLLNDKCQYSIKRAIHQHNLTCLACQKTVSIADCPLEKFSQELGQREGFRVTEHHMELYGYCRECTIKSGGKKA